MMEGIDMVIDMIQKVYNLLVNDYGFDDELARGFIEKLLNEKD